MVKDGLIRLLKNGFSLENAHYNLIPTYTAVGHASIYTGTTPSEHGLFQTVGMINFQRNLFIVLTMQTTKPLVMMSDKVKSRLTECYYNRNRSITFGAKHAWKNHWYCH